MGADYLKYEFTRPDGVRVTTILEGGKARIMKEGGEGSGSTLAMLERSQLTLAETALLQEVSAIGWKLGNFYRSPGGLPAQATKNRLWGGLVGCDRGKLI